MYLLFRGTSGSLRSPGTRMLLLGAGRSYPPRIGPLVGGKYKDQGPPPFLLSRKVHGLRTQNCRPMVANDYQHFRWCLSVPLHPALPYTRRCLRNPILLNPRAHLGSHARRDQGLHRRGCLTHSGVLSVNPKLRMFLLLRRRLRPLQRRLHLRLRLPC